MPMTRRSDHPISPLFLARWSPRAYDGQPMPKADLLTMLEAGRWAPSAFNAQPWRFLFALRDDPHWAAFQSLLAPFNAMWAKDASALIFLLSDTVLPGDADRRETPAQFNSFDAGAAWMQLALQASELGYAAHAMAGLDFEAARRVLSLPNRFRLEVGIAIGRRTDAAVLPEDLREREVPSTRKPMADIAHQGPFPLPSHAIAAQ